MANKNGLPRLSRQVFEEMSRRHGSTVDYQRQKYYNAKHLDHLKECLALEQVLASARNKKESVVIKQLLTNVVYKASSQALVREIVDEVGNASY